MVSKDAWSLRRVDGFREDDKEGRPMFDCVPRSGRWTLLALVPLALIGRSGGARADDGYRAVVDPSIQYQTLQGWGTSLAWWGNVVGGFPEPVRSDYISKVFDPVDGLGFNVVRYNIGGGE